VYTAWWGLPVIDAYLHRPLLWTAAFVTQLLPEAMRKFSNWLGLAVVACLRTGAEKGCVVSVAQMGSEGVRAEATGNVRKAVRRLFIHPYLAATAAAARDYCTHSCGSD
jgi:hypothetical protein